MFLSKLYERYLARTILSTTSLTLLALVGLLIVFKFIDESEDLNTGNYRLMDALWVALLSAPHYLLEAFPMAALLGGLLGLGGLASRSELVALRAAGISVKQILLAVIQTGLLLALCVIICSEWLAPYTEQQAQQWRLVRQQGTVTHQTDEGLWARDGNTFIHIAQVHTSTQLSNVTSYILDENNQLRTQQQAASAYYRNGHWQLQNITHTHILPDNNQIRTEQQDHARWDTLLNPALLAVIITDPALLTLPELHQTIRYLQDNGQNALTYQLAYWHKIINPVTTLLMLLLALPFVLSQPQRGTGQRMMLGVLIGASYFLLSRGLSYAAVAYALNPLLVIFIPVLFCLASIGYLLQRVR
ncbi:MAG: LPS export ABC transporter permease LptG, partial [Pseudomonadota bacterium]